MSDRAVVDPEQLAALEAEGVGVLGGAEERVQPVEGGDLLRLEGNALATRLAPPEAAGHRQRSPTWSGSTERALLSVWSPVVSRVIDTGTRSLR